MTIQNLPDPILIANQASLERMLKALNQEATLAVDTEANSLYAYQERVCLIQISTLDADYLIDPLAIEDFTSLIDIFKNPKIEKIFHASEYDVIMLAKDLGFQFANIFDTMLAARILGREKMGLNTLLEEFFGIQVDKRYQKADWGKRPLPMGMLRYAQIDTHYLIDLRNILFAELLQAERWPLAQEDFALACRPLTLNGHKLPPCWRGRDIQNLSPRNAAVYQKLCEYRDGIAKKRDQPLFKVLSSKDLLTLAEACPQTQNELRSLRGLSQRSIQQHATGLLKAIQAGLEAEPFLPPHPKRKTSAYLNRIQALKQWRTTAAKKMGVNSSVILPRHILHTVANKNPHTPEELAQILKEVPWRLEHFGMEILEVLNN